MQVESKLFMYCYELKGVLLIPITPIQIQNYAFTNCYSINKVVFSNKTRDILDYTFTNCTGLTGQLIFPDNVKSFGNSMFVNCT